MISGFLFLMCNFPLSATRKRTYCGLGKMFQVPVHILLSEQVDEGIDGAVKGGRVEDTKVEEPAAVVQVVPVEEVKNSSDEITAV